MGIHKSRTFLCLPLVSSHIVKIESDKFGRGAFPQEVSTSLLTELCSTPGCSLALHPLYLVPKKQIDVPGYVSGTVGNNFTREGQS